MSRCRLIESQLLDRDPALGRFSLEAESGVEIPAFQAGQAFPVAFEGPEGLVQRWYAAATPPARLPRLEFLVADGGGRGSRDLFALQEGDPVWVGTAAGSFTLARTRARHLLLLAAGTGIAPYRAMLGQLREDAREGRVLPVTVALLHGARRGAGLAWREEFEELASRQPFRFVYLPCVSRSESDPDFDPEGTVAGRSAEAAARILGLASPSGAETSPTFPPTFDPEALAALLPAEDSAVFLCGSPAMIDDFEAVCADTPWAERLVFDRWW